MLKPLNRADCAWGQEQSVHGEEGHREGEVRNVVSQVDKHV